MFYSDDPVWDAERYEAARDAEVDRLPKCEYCGEPILTDECYEINEALICPECLIREHRKWTDSCVAL